MSSLLKSAAEGIGSFFGVDPSTTDSVLSDVGSVAKTAVKGASALSSVLGTVSSAQTAQDAGNKAAAADQISADNALTVGTANSDTVIKAATLNQQIANVNAQLYQKEAQSTLQVGADEAGDEVQKARQTAATARAITGASGTQVNSGNNLRMSVQNAGTGVLNAETIVNNAQRAAYGFQVQAADSTLQGNAGMYDAELESNDIMTQAQANASNDLNEADQTATTGGAQATSSLLNGAVNFGTKILPYLMS